MTNIANIILVVSFYLLSLMMGVSYLSNQCMSFQNGPVMSSNLCGNTLLIASILMLLISIYSTYILCSSKSKKSSNQTEEK